MNWGLYFLYSAGPALTEKGNKWGGKKWENAPNTCSSCKREKRSHATSEILKAGKVLIVLQALGPNLIYGGEGEGGKSVCHFLSHPK